MKQNKIAKGLLLVIGIIAMFFLITFIVMWLWNALLPEIIGVKSITFWQAMGILVLSKILFGGIKGGGKGKFGHCKKQEWKDRFENFSPEDKDLFKEKLKERFANSRWCQKQ